MQAGDKNEVYDRITVLHAAERALIGGIIMDVNVHEIIVLRDKKVQARTHKKKRINKKWAKRYGFKTYENQLFKNGQMIVMGQKIYMNERTYEALKKTCSITLRNRGWRIGSEVTNMYLDKKAIALINAPKSCGECCFQKGLTVYGYACGIAKTMNKDTRNRPDWCPLIPLPKRHTAPKTATGYEIGYEDGWNDCLDKIAGGE